MRSLQLMGLRAQEESKAPGEKESFAAGKHEVEKGNNTSPAVCSMEGFRSWHIM